MKTFLRVIPVFMLAVILAGGAYAQDSLLPPSLDEILAEEGGETEAAEEAVPAKKRGGFGVGRRGKTAVVEEKSIAVPVGTPRVAVLPFGNSAAGGSASEAATKSSAPVIVDLLVNSGRVDVIERSRMDDILREVEFGKSGLVETGAAVKMGKMLGATYIVTGDVRRAEKKREVMKFYGIESTKDTYNVEILVRVIDGATGRIVSSQKAKKEQVEIITQYSTKSDSDIITPLMEEALESVIDGIVEAIAPAKKAEERFVFKVDSTPKGADVEINGMFEGNCPLEAELEAGVHVLKVSLPGYEEWEKKVKVRKDAARPIVARLRPKPTTTETNVNVNLDK